MSNLTTKGKPRGRNGGRKPAGEAPMVHISVTIRQDHVEWLEGKNRSEQVQDALDLLVKKSEEVGK